MFAADGERAWRAKVVKFVTQKTSSGIIGRSSKGGRVSSQQFCGVRETSVGFSSRPICREESFLAQFHGKFSTAGPTCSPN